METKTGILGGLLLAAALALGGGVLLAVWLIGADGLRVLAGYAVGGGAAAAVLAALALPIRAWRKNDAAPIERQVIRETRIIDGRPPAAPQLPALNAQPFGVFPELLRASYRAGLLAQPEEVIDAAAVRQLPTGDGWSGDITE